MLYTCYVTIIYCFVLFFFFKQKTAYEMRISDWSSDVCSSDLGPRIYSTDLLPSHFNPEQPEESVELAARALKVKMITKGIVTLNSAYLVSPLGVLLMDKHPDLFSGEAIVPEFRTDQESLEIGRESSGERGGPVV